MRKVDKKSKKFSSTFGAAAKRSGSLWPNEMKFSVELPQPSPRKQGWGILLSCLQWSLKLKPKQKQQWQLGAEKS